MDLKGRKKSKNVVDISREPTERQRSKGVIGPMLDVAMDSQKRGEPMARRERPPLPNWYAKERGMATRPDAKAYSKHYWKGNK